MAKPHRLRELESELGDLERVIVPLVNRIGQRRTAEQLGISEFTVNTFLKQRGYRLTRQYVKAGQDDRA